MDWLTMSLGFGSGGAVLWVLKKIPNENICGVVEVAFESLGKTLDILSHLFSFAALLYSNALPIVYL